MNKVSRIPGLIPCGSGPDSEKQNNNRNTMKSKLICIALAIGATTGLGLAQDAKTAPDGPPPAANDGAPARDAKPRGGLHLLPPRAKEQLNLTADQEKQLADLEAEVKAKVEKILTPEQLEKLKQMRPPMRPGAQGGPGGQGKPGGQGGPEGQGGPGDHPQPPPPQE